MKRLLLSAAAVLFAFSVNAQISSDTLTYTRGTLGVQAVFPVNINSQSSCADTMGISIPSGHWISSIELKYEVQTQGGGFGGVAPNDVGTYVEFVSESTKETGLTYGTSGTNGTTESVSRTINEFNGAVTDTFLVFKLHPLRQAFTAACDTNSAKITDSTYQIIVNHYPAPTCFQPTNLAVDWTMSDQAQLSWTTGGSSSWEVEYGAPGFTPGTGTRLAALTNPFVVTGLTASTSYEFIVRDSCAVGNTSIWSAAAEDSTRCAPITFTTSYTENFNSTTDWVPGSGFDNDGSTVPSCWPRNPTSPNGGQGYAWGVADDSTGTPGTGPSAGRGGSGQYIYAEASGAANQSVAEITSPLIDLSALSVPELNFYYHMRGAQINELKTEVWSKTTGWVNVGAINGPQQTALSDTFLLQTYTLSQFVNDTVLVRFSASRGFGNANQADIAIDDFGFQEAPTCPDPSNLLVAGRTMTSITLGWTAVNATSWDIQYGAPGAALGATANTTISASTNPKEVTGLSSGTTYQFWVREVCGPTDKSGWVGPILATTHCTPVTAPWSEDFDSTTWTAGTGVYNTGDALAACWVRTPEKDTLPSSPFSWGVRSGTTTTGQTGPTSDVSGSGNYLYAEASGGAPNQEAFVESPMIDMSALLKPQVSFYYNMRGFFVNTLKLQVWVDSTQTWDTYFTKSGNQGNQWLFEEVDLSGFAGDTIVLRWSATKGNGAQGDIAIDEVVVEDQPLCPDPSNFALTDVTSTTATFSWTSGGSTTWNLVVGTTGFTPSATGLTNLTTTTGVATGLTAGTSYDAYVRDTCGALGASMWIGPITFNTLCNPLTAPYTENFDSTSWVTGANQTPGQIDGCWQRSDTVEYFWKAGPPTNHSNNTGPSGDHTSGSGGYAFTEANTGFGGSSIFTNELISPLVDVSPLTTPEMTFWYHMYGTLINKLVVQVRTAGGSWTTLSTINGAQQSSSNDAWKEQIVDLTAYAGDTIQVKFIAHRYQGFNNQVDISLDDVDIHEKPNCPKPSNLVASNVTSNSVDLSWTTGGSTNWLVKYTPGSIVSAGTNPFTLTGLSPNTTYSIYVRDSCAAGDVSPWEGPITVTTLCGMETAPWTEDFEGTGFDASTGDFDGCYTTSTSTTYFWQTGTGATPTNNTGPSADHTSGSGKYGYIETSFGFNGDTEADMETMEIDLDTLSTPELSFWWHAAGGNIDEMEVEIYDGSTWTSELTINSTNNTLQSGPGDPWQEAVIDLSSYAGDTIKVRFTGSRASTFGFTSTQADWAIDDIEIDNAPTCLKPTAIASTASTTTSITLSWTTGGASNWQIEYGAPGFTPGTGTIVNATTNPYTVTGLAPSTYYDFWVRDSCGATDVSDWAGAFAAATACGTAVAPYLENFDNGFVGGTDNNQGHNIGATISPCWSRTDTDTNYRWGGRTGTTATGPTGPSGDHTSGFGSYVYTESSFSTGTPSATLTSPSIDLSALTTPEMKFWYHMWAQGNGSQGTLVWAIQDVAVGTWVDLDSISGNQGNNWIEVVEDLSSYANKTVKIRFTSTKSSGNNAQWGDIAIDDLSIDEAPTCPEPTAVVAVATSTTDVDVSWTTGGSTAWQIEYGAPGFTPGTGTIVNALTNPFTVTGLTSGASYDFYVRDSCGAGDVSMWVGPASATTFTCTGGCTYTLELGDDYGDGWGANGQYSVFHQLAVTTGSVTTNYTMSNTTGALGSSETFTFNVCDGDTLYLEFIDNGQWDDECGYTLKDPNGVVVSSVANGSMTPGIKYQGSANCSSPCPAPVPTFTFTDNFLSVDFDATASTGAALTYAWDFGDGNNGTGDTPTHLYGAGGTYVVTLTATDSCNQSIDFVDTIQVCEELTTANITYTQSAFDINFDASGVAGADSAYWTFGDGNTGNGLNPTNTYSGSGNFQVDVTVYNACGDQADTTFFVTICVQPTATFSAQILSAGGGGMQVQFDGTNSTGGSSYLWNFGDGNTNTTSNYPLHTYAVTSTTYVVSLTVYNTCGDSDTYSSVLGDALGEDEYTLFNVKVFPNPAKGFITLESDAGMEGTISLIDALGRTVVEINANGMSNQVIDVRDLSAGTYVLRVLNNGQLFQERVQIVK
ncbi:MAG: fibronectin type III domain-containing protein [Schleiferiaceae bacterium]